MAAKAWKTGIRRFDANTREANLFAEKVAATLKGASIERTSIRVRLNITHDLKLKRDYRKATPPTAAGQTIIDVRRISAPPRG
jgi:hypothetical protein